MSEKINIGDTVVCTSAASDWYTVGKIYEVHAHPNNGYKAVQASDGLFDLLSLASSKFSKVDKSQIILDEVSS